VSYPRALWADSRRLETITVSWDSHNGWDLELAGMRKDALALNHH